MLIPLQTPINSWKIQQCIQRSEVSDSVLHTVYANTQLLITHRERLRFFCKQKIRLFCFFFFILIRQLWAGRDRLFDQSNNSSPRAASLLPVSAGCQGLIQPLTPSRHEKREWGKTYKAQNKTADSSGSCQFQSQWGRSSSKFTEAISDQTKSVINIIHINHVGERETVRVRDRKIGLLHFNKLNVVFRDSCKTCNNTCLPLHVWVHMCAYPHNCSN